jgi:hypothetical protein
LVPQDLKESTSLKELKVHPVATVIWDECYNRGIIDAVGIDECFINSSCVKGSGWLHGSNYI